VIRDVTAQVAQEAALEAATAAAETAAAAKSEFLANMSHEIRTPLTAVLGFTGLLSAREDLSVEAQGQVERVASAGKALLSIVNDILDFSKLEAGQYEIHPRPVSPRQAAQDALRMFEVQAAARGLALEFMPEGVLPDAVAIDPERFRQILLNLIGNAVKFTDEGAVRLRIRHDPGEGKLHACVEDTGAGMSGEQQRALFQRFSQVDASSARRHGGTGLGLAICKGLAEAMGGEIGVRSEPGRGSAFYFSIAAPEAALDTGHAEPAPQALSLEGVRLLVVDDNRMNRELARAILENLGAEFTEAEDGLSALEIARESAFDAVLLDIRMPGLDGPAVLQRLRAAPGPNQHAPILAFSADAELERFEEQGFDGVVRKPIEAMALVLTIIETLTATRPPRSTPPEIDIARLGGA
jgi:CheY-like chemotaxis protein/nitrogen-specific signal transduction histidine kinase